MKFLAATAAALTVVAARTPATNHERSAPLNVRAFHRDGVLGTSADFRFVSRSPVSAQRAERVALDEIERLRRVLSTWDANSEISVLFARGSLPHPSPELLSVLRQYASWSARSGQAYSARVGELTALWRQAEQSGTLPDARALATTTKAIAAPAWRIEPNGSVVALTSRRVDLSSMGKGFIIDHAMQAVRDSVPDIEGALVNIGGDVRVWGVAPDGEAWHVAVANPVNHADNAKPLALLSVNSANTQALAVSSSGNYERGFDIGGQHYSHIIDPRSGQPARAVVGATVVAANNATANALATTLTVLSPDSGLALVASVPGAEALIVMANGETRRSAGFSRYETATNYSASSAASIAAKLAIDVTPGVPNRHAPYVAVWVTDTAGQHVRTLAFWGDKPKYLHEMSRWWSLNRNDAGLIDAVTRASRPAGKYSLEWDGADQKGAAVAPGSYTFWLEVGFEDGAHSAKSVTLACGASADVTGAIPQAAAFTGAEISCGPAKK